MEEIIERLRAEHKRTDQEVDIVWEARRKKEGERGRETVIAARRLLYNNQGGLEIDPEYLAEVQDRDPFLWQIILLWKQYEGLIAARYNLSRAIEATLAYQKFRTEQEEDLLLGQD